MWCFHFSYRKKTTIFSEKYEKGIFFFPFVFVGFQIEGGSAEKDGRLMSGDLIVEVNGKDLRTAAYEQVAYTLKVKDFHLIFSC